MLNNIYLNEIRIIIQFERIKKHKTSNKNVQINTWRSE
jgi:hypothetical protein